MAKDAKYVALMTPKSEGLPALAILIVGVAVSVASFIFLDNLEDEKARAQFAVVVEQRSDDLEKSLSHTLESVVSLSALYAASEFVNRAEFSRFASIELAERPEI